MIESSETTHLFESLGDYSHEEYRKVEEANFPFSKFEFLSAMEASGAVGPGTGWLPLYFCNDKKDLSRGFSYLYEKWDSYGEYIFDWDWARGAHQAGIRYFPKLVSAVPFTPATGHKLLPIGLKGSEKLKLIKGAISLAEERGYSSLHYLFLAKNELPLFREAELLIRHSFQFHWFNRSYQCFDDFLGKLKSRKRKQIKKERRSCRESGLSFERLTGSQLTEDDALRFYPFYLSTIDKKFANAYLPQSFFSQLFTSQNKDVHLFVAKKEETWVGAALCLQSGVNLFGRYWGCLEEYRYLHFELCYYRPIEWAIHCGMEKYEAGAQGEHKIQRGFDPVFTYSAHWIAHPMLKAAIASYIESERKGLVRAFEMLKGESPYKFAHET